MTIAELSTARLLLRDVLDVNVAAFQGNFANYEIIGQLAAVVPWPYPADGARHFLASVAPTQGGDRWVWAIYRRQDPAAPIGSVDLRRVHAVENRGFWLARQYWGYGYMTEATNAVTDYAFDVLGFETLVLTNAVGNIRSRRLKEKAGAVFVRTEPARFVNPAYTEREVWELTKADWKNRR